MCEYCRQHPCPAGCPNAAPKVIGHCDQCDLELLKNHLYYKDNADNFFCSEECALEFYGVKEVYDGE